MTTSIKYGGVWRESKASRLYEELGEDFTHPRYLEAEQRSRKALIAFLGQRTASLRHILFKLQIACEVEDYLADAMNPAWQGHRPCRGSGDKRGLRDFRKG